MGNTLPLMSSLRLLSVVRGVRNYYVRFLESGNTLPMMSSSRLLSVVGGVRNYYDRFWESGRLVANDVVIKVTVRCRRSSQLLC